LEKEELKIAIAAKCAGRQGRYLQFLNQLYSNMKEVKSGNLLPYAKNANFY
jgi:protein-disulfide isomerase